MRRKKLKYIEDYIFAKTLNLLAKNTNVSRENKENYNLLSKALITSEQLLEQSEIQIKENKLNDISFLILKKELETTEIYNNQEKNIEKLKEMLSLLSM